MALEKYFLNPCTASYLITFGILLVMGFMMKLREKGGKGLKELNENHAVGTDTNKEQLLETEQTYDHLEEAINELAEEQRQCVILFYLKKNSYQQISDKTGYSLLQVKSYIQNGKRNLKIILEKKMKEGRKK